jgi:hypothetical protein
MKLDLNSLLNRNLYQVFGVCFGWAPGLRFSPFG